MSQALKPFGHEDSKTVYVILVDQSILIFPGPMSHLFVGVHEQSYIAHVVDYATETWEKQQEVQEPKITNSASIVKSLDCAIIALLVFTRQK